MGYKAHWCVSGKFAIDEYGCVALGGFYKYCWRFRYIERFGVVEFKHGLVPTTVSKNLNSPGVYDNLEPICTLYTRVKTVSRVVGIAWRFDVDIEMIWGTSTIILI